MGVDARCAKEVSPMLSRTENKNNYSTNSCPRKRQSQHHGFFLPKSPPTLLMAFVGFCAWLFTPPGTNPPAQPSCDLSIPAARPPISGTNLGSAVVPWTVKGMVVPFLQLAFPPLPSRPPGPLAAPETGLATVPGAAVRVAAI